MRYVSQLFQPVITIPKGAKIKNTEITCKSQKLLVECGLVRPTGAGLLALLPLARRALDKLEALAAGCLEAAGAQRVSLPALTAARLWRASGRLQAAGPELLRLEDRHGKEYLLAPTHEEAVSELLADVGPLSHRQLPLVLYQISNKYRDEHRPKHGLLRAREFSMLDAYSAHGSARCAAHTYERLTDAYAQLFRRLGLAARRVSAPSGDMGGSLSHEWQLPARAGEDMLALCPSCSHAELAPPPAPAAPAAPAACPRCGHHLDTCNSIEVGHTFVLGERYSAPLQALHAPPEGRPAPLTMACYGIGLTRLLAAALEALSSDTALRWPRALAPYTLLFIGPKEGSREWGGGGEGGAARERLAAALAARLPGGLLLDDRHALTVGRRLLAARRVGYPYVVVCGRATLESPARYELHEAGAEPRPPALLTADQLLAAVAEAADDDAEDVLASC